MKDFNDKNQLDDRTVLGVGPVSKITVDVALELSRQRKCPIWLIPSRRQVECKELGGGYVNGWSTEEFVKYVKDRDGDHLISFVRDHGGPKQGKVFKDEREDYEASLISFREDIRCGFDILHVDLSNLHEYYPKIEPILSDLNEDNIAYEVNIDKHSAKLTATNFFETWIEDVINKFGNVKFIAGNVGLFVYEAKNTNFVDKNTLKELLRIAYKTDTVYMQHNCDYLRDEIFLELREAGVKVVNVAPEYGVIETTALLGYLDAHNLKHEKDAFISLVASGDKWKKWFDHVGAASDLDKALVSGHYYLNSPFVLGLKERYPMIDAWCFNRVQARMNHHLDLLGW
jgi:hypothetical protein